MDEAYAPTTMDELLALLPAGARVLDVGCGGGSFRYADYPHLAIVAIDEVAPPADRPFPPGVHFARGSAEALPLQPDSCDLVIANFVLEHVRDFPRAVDEIARVIRPQGHLYMAVPNARSFEDALYRALYAGGGHVQRHTLASVIATVYGRTTLKLLAYNEWPAGFTFLDDREALRALVDQFATACRESLQIDVRAASNYLLVFQRQEGIGRRVTAKVCGYCGAGGPDEGSAEAAWVCPACGKRNGGYERGEASDDRLDTEMRALWDRHPHLRPVAPLTQVVRRGRRLGRRIVDRLLRRA
jgi:SAM-dependent methyltransferase